MIDLAMGDVEEVEDGGEDENAENAAGEVEDSTGTAEGDAEENDDGDEDDSSVTISAPMSRETTLGPSPAGELQ